jgi:putative hydrolase of the HAD superfamily
MSEQGIRCVTFDLDNTLWPITETIEKAEQALYLWLCSHYPRISQKYSLMQLREFRLALARSYPELQHDVTLLRERSLYQLAEEFRYSSSLVQDAMAIFMRYRNRVSLYPEAHEVLKCLSQQFILGVISNGNADIDVIGLSGYFTFVTTAAQAGVSKPDRRIFAHAASVAGLPCNAITHIGDDPCTDVLGAMNAGFRSIWLNRTRQAWPGGQTPHHVVHTLKEVPIWLAANK